MKLDVHSSHERNQPEPGLLDGVAAKDDAMVTQDHDLVLGSEILFDARSHWLINQDAFVVMVTHAAA